MAKTISSSARPIVQLGKVPKTACSTVDVISGVAANASLTIIGGNRKGTGTFTATCNGALDKAGNVGSASI